MRRKAGLAVEGQAVTLTVAMLQRLVGGPGRSRTRALVERHVAVCRGVMQTVTLEVRQMLERRGA